LPARLGGTPANHAMRRRDLSHPWPVTSVLPSSTIELLVKRLGWRMLYLSGTSCESEENCMADFLRKTWSRRTVADIAEYMVMLFVTLMTGVSTLRLLGLLP